MPDQEESTTQKLPTFEFVEPEDGLVFVYANQVQLTGSLWDLRMVFGESLGFDGTKVTIEQRASITLAWPQVKVLCQLLAANIKQYESRNGEIKIPKGFLEQLTGEGEGGH